MAIFPHTVGSLNASKPLNSRLTAISIIKNSGVSKVECICDCGNKKTVQIYKFISGHSKSCGCLVSESAQKAHRVYYPAIQQLINAYHSMLSRCYRKADKRYYCYGGRGVTVCDDWRKDYKSFAQWALKNGFEKGLQLDKDIKGNGLLYSPDTCCWVTGKVNCRNRQDNTMFLFKDQMLTAGQISDLSGVKEALLYSRMTNGRTAEEAINFIHKRRKNVITL